MAHINLIIYCSIHNLHIDAFGELITDNSPVLFVTILFKLVRMIICFSGSFSNRFNRLPCLEGSIHISSMLMCSKNGELVGAINKEVKGDLFPTIAVHSQNEEYACFPLS